MQKHHGRARSPILAAIVTLISSAGLCINVHAQTRDFTTRSKLLLTGGVTNIEGSAGGGLTPGAIIGARPPQLAR